MRRATTTSMLLACALCACSGGAGGGDVTDAEADGDEGLEVSELPETNAIDAIDALDDAWDAGDSGAVAIDADAPSAEVDAPLEPGGTYFYNLRAAPFPGTGHPDVAVHVPRGFDTRGRIGLVVFFHGFDNCVANVIGPADSPCSPGGPARTALHLVAQLDAARVNAILVAVQLRFEQATGDPGQLTKAGDLRDLLHELLTEHLDAALVAGGGRAIDLADVERVVIGSHSGGYQAAAMAISVGSVAQIREVDLYDSLYGDTAQFDGWMKPAIARFDVAKPDALRFTDVYTTGGGTAANSRAMEARAKGWLDGVGLSASLYFDDTTATPTAADYGKPVVFKLSGLAHVDVPRYYFGRFLAVAGFAPLP